MNINTIKRHLKTLSKVKEFEVLMNNLLYVTELHAEEVKTLKLSDYKFRMKSILLECCYENNIDIKCKDLNLTHFINPMFGIYTLDLVKLDAWLYNELLDVYGHRIHDMSGVEKLRAYVENNKIMRWV